MVPQGVTPEGVKTCVVGREGLSTFRGGCQHRETESVVRAHTYLPCTPVGTFRQGSRMTFRRPK